MVEQERKNKQRDGKPSSAHNQPQDRWARLRAWIQVRWRWTRIRWRKIVCWAVVIVLVVGSLVALSRYVSRDTDPIQFVTGNLLNVLIFAAIMAQVLIYRKQRDIMRHQWRAMQGQLETIEKQAGFMETQTQAALKAADMAMGQLIVMRGTLGHDQEQALKDAIDRVKQLQIMDKQALISETQMEIAGEAAKITERQLEAMKDQAKTMDRSLVLGTRAYVGVHSIIFDWRRKGILLQVENIGRVPAKDIKVVLELMIRIQESLMPIPLPERGWGFKKGMKSDDPAVLTRQGEWVLQIPWIHSYGRTKLFPGSLRIGILIPLAEKFYITSPQYEEIKAGNADVYVRGVITYSDGFHKGKRTDFAFRYYPRQLLWVAIPDTTFEKFQTDPEKPDSDYNPN